VFSAEFDALNAAAESGQVGVLDHYGASSPAEFFAVATEAFFEKSKDLARYHPVSSPLTPLYPNPRETCNLRFFKMSRSGDGRASVDCAS
jgi:Mlc titration factor MtfA (ptsG expression regulator)